MVGSYTDAETDRLRRTADDLREEIRDLRTQNFDLRMELQRERSKLGWAQFHRRIDAIFAVAFLLVAALDIVVIAVKSGQPHLIAAAVALIPVLVFMPAILFVWE